MLESDNGTTNGTKYVLFLNVILDSWTLRNTDGL